MTQQENEKNDNISLSSVGAPGAGSNGGGGPTGSEPPGSSPFDFPGMGGANHNPPEPTLDLLGQGGMNVSTSMASNPGGPMHINGPPVPNSIQSMGVGPSPTGLMGQPNQGTNQMNQNSGAKPPTTKSHLAEILGSHEMHQLQTMSRTLDNCPPNSLPQSRPNNPGNNSLVIFLRTLIYWYNVDLLMSHIRDDGNATRPNGRVNGKFQSNATGRLSRTYGCLYGRTKHATGKLQE